MKLKKRDFIGQARQVGQAGQGKQKVESRKQRTENGEGRLWDFVREWL